MRWQWIMYCRGEFAYYLSRQKELARDYEGKFLIIKDKSVIASYDDLDSALYGALDRGLKVGEFLLQECSADPRLHIVKFRSRVRF